MNPMILVALCCLVVSLLAGPAKADDDQDLNDTFYAKCMADGKFGETSEALAKNCKCATDVSVPLFTDEAKQKMLNALRNNQLGTIVFSAFPFKVSKEAYAVRLLSSCRGLRPIMMKHFCADPSSKDCKEMKARFPTE